jgi:hypothetical protein
VIPTATTFVRPFQIDPVDYHHRQAHVVQAARHERVEVLAHTSHEFAADG